MAVPKQRKTKSRQGNRRGHIKLEEVKLNACPKCGKKVRAHTICLNCGTYKGKEVVDVLKKLEKRERKQKEKELEEQKEQTGEMSMEEMSKK